MASIFTRIIQGEIPCHKLLEDERYFAFLDIQPVSRGHALVIPKQETDRLFDLEDDLLAGLLPFARRVALAIEATVPCKRVGIMVAGLDVPHAHVHLIPMQSGASLNFANAKPADPAELKQLAEAIRAQLGEA